MGLDDIPMFPPSRPISGVFRSLTQFSTLFPPQVKVLPPTEPQNFIGLSLQLKKKKINEKIFLTEL